MVLSKWARTAAKSPLVMSSAKVTDSAERLGSDTVVAVVLLLVVDVRLTGTAGLLGLPLSESAAAMPPPRMTSAPAARANLVPELATVGLLRGVSWAVARRTEAPARRARSSRSLIGSVPSPLPASWRARSSPGAGVPARWPGSSPGLRRWLRRRGPRHSAGRQPRAGGRGAGGPGPRRRRRAPREAPRWAGGQGPDGRVPEPPPPVSCAGNGPG